MAVDNVSIRPCGTGTTTPLTTAATSTPTPTSPPTTQASTQVSITSSTATLGVPGQVDMMVKQDWGSRFEGELHFPLKEDVEGWMANVTFSKPVTAMDVPIGIVTWHSADGLQWTVKNRRTSASFPAGDTLDLHFYAKYNQGQGQATGAPSATGVLTNLAEEPSFTIISPSQVPGSKYNYDDVLMKSILFYEAQRSGKLPPTNRIPWRGDSALGDHGDDGEDLTGGWYDAGDHVKFNFPMAYSATVLAWGALRFADAYRAAGQMAHVLDSIRWPLEYLAKCHVGADTLYVQVGDPAIDHAYWGRPEDMTMTRPAYKINASHPGSDVSMETAAAFAAGAMVFNQTDQIFSNSLLVHAKILWQFAVDNPGRYSDSVHQARNYYPSSNYTDEMCWGSMWLYKATGDDKYLTEAKRWFDPSPDWGMSWDDKVVACQLMLFEATGEEKYRRAVVGTFRNWFPGGSISYTPTGLAWRLQWAPLRYSSNMAMMALLAADDGIEPAALRNWATCQTHYALGDAGRSYVVGYGKDPPTRAHHRGASCPSPPAPCDYLHIMADDEANMHVLYGALVGGPDQSDAFKDARAAYVMDHVACDYNAGFQTAVAGLRSLLVRGEHPEQSENLTCPYTSTFP